MKISGINGTNCLLESMVKLRIERKMIDRAEIVKRGDGYVIQFHGDSADWNGEPMELCSARNPYEPRIFKSLDGAVSQIAKIGLDNIQITAMR